MNTETASSDRSPEHRVTVLLNLLDPVLAEAVLRDLPPDRQRRLTESLKQLKASPPDRREVHDVLREFDHLLRIAMDPNLLGTLEDQQRVPAPTKVEEEEPLSDDPFRAISQVREIRLVAALRDEVPRTAALVLNALPEAKAARVLQQLAKEKRDAVMLQLKERLTPSMALMTQLLTATVAKCQSFVEQELVAESVPADARVARLLRTMEAERRGEVLEFLETADPAATEQIRNALFSIEDLLRVDDKTLQRIAGEVDTQMLAVILKSGTEELRQRVLANLSKRGREAMIEEMELMANIPKTAVEDAQKSIVRIMVELDKVGELRMKSN